MQVTVYSKPDCPYCVNSKSLLQSKNIPYNELKLNEDFTKEFLLELFPNARTFPVIVIDGFHIGGYTQLVQKLNEETVDNRKFLSEEGK